MCTLYGGTANVTTWTDICTISEKPYHTVYFTCARDNILGFAVAKVGGISGTCSIFHRAESAVDTYEFTLVYIV